MKLPLDNFFIEVELFYFLTTWVLQGYYMGICMIFLQFIDYSGRKVLPKGE